MTKILKGLFSPKKKEDEKASVGACSTDVIVVGAAHQKVSQDDFEVLGLLGKGAFGKVALVRKKDTQQQYAMKVILKESLLDKGRVQDLFSERSVLRRARHSFITNLHFAFQSTHKLYFVMEYMPGGDLEGLLKNVPGLKFSEELATFYAAQIFSAIQYLHDIDIIYRDLKPENILLDMKGNAHLADFGLAKDFQLAEGSDKTDRTQSFVGSPYYVAPDVLQKKGYGRAIDWWSFGILVFRMLAGAPPFSGRNVRELFHSIVHDEPNLAPYPWINATSRDFLLRLLQKNEAKRMTGPQAKAHPFFANIKWDQLMTKTLPVPSDKAPVVTRRNSAPREAVEQDFSSSPQTAIPPAQQAMFDGFTCGTTPSLANVNEFSLARDRHQSIRAGAGRRPSI